MSQDDEMWRGAMDKEREVIARLAERWALSREGEARQTLIDFAALIRTRIKQS